VVFYGTLEGYLKAVDAQTGEELYRFKTPSGIIGNVMTYTTRASSTSASFRASALGRHRPRAGPSRTTVGLRRRRRIRRAQRSSRRSAGSD
jgi:hypothetical protein